MFSDPLTRDVIEASKTTTKPIFVIWGAPSGTDDTYYKRLLDGGLPDVPHVRKLRRGREGVRRLLVVRGAVPLAVRVGADHAAAGRQEGPQAARRARTRRGALGVELEAAPGGLRDQDQQGRAVHVGQGRGEGGDRDRVPGRHEGLLARPAAQERRRAREGRRRVGQGGARRVRRAARQGAARRTRRRASRACSCARW